VLGVDLGLFTVIVGHATFCIVVYNNVIARYLAHRLTREEGGVAAARGGRGARAEGGGVETEATAVP
jgi:hypothetical protein